MMKRKFLFLNLLLSVACLFSCKNDNLEERFEVSLTSLNISELGGLASFGIMSNGSWTISGYDSWLTCSPTSGTGNFSVQIAVTENKFLDNRTCTLTLKSEGGITKSVQVTQNRFVPSITLEPDAAKLRFTSEDITVNVTANSAWTVEIPEDVNWVSYKSLTDTQAVFSVDENETTEERFALVNFKLTDYDAQTTFNLTQDGLAFVIIEPEMANVEYTGEEITINVNASNDWQVIIPENADWVSLKTQTETSAVLDIAANTSSNERSVGITFKLLEFDMETVLTISQGGAEYEINRSLFSLAVFPGDYSVPNGSGNQVERVWTNPVGISNNPFITPPDGHVLPQWFTIDLGGTYVLTKIKMFQRGDTGNNANRLYAGGCMKEFEVWGSLNPDFSYNPDDHAGDFGSDWTLLQSCVVNRPSGNILGPSGATRPDNAANDIAEAVAGHEYLFNYTGEIRYLRIKTITNWDGDGRSFTTIASIALWALH